MVCPQFLYRHGVFLCLPFYGLHLWILDIQLRTPAYVLCVWLKSVQQKKKTVTKKKEKGPKVQTVKQQATKKADKSPIQSDTETGEHNRNTRSKE